MSEIKLCSSDNGVIQRDSWALHPTTLHIQQYRNKANSMSARLHTRHHYGWRSQVMEERPALDAALPVLSTVTKIRDGPEES